ncbi:MAG TPA: hypothetical protein VG821_05215 [Rhizomicrobium sp.]|jgi:hypothetical protein|nr:hypothetical protein [Rhizomicrobium sp.]
MAPLSQGEAQGIARQRLVKYCGSGCSRLAPVRTQKIKDRWLVDFEDPLHKFTVTVEDNGSAKVTTWSK